jgi:BON domain-containing protein
MANRYDRDPDDNGFGRRDPRDQSRDDERRPGQSFAQGPYGENRQQGGQQGNRQSPWRDARNDPDDRFGQGDRGSWRETNDNNYFSGRNNDWSGRENYYSSGRDRDSYTGREPSYDRGNRGNFQDRGDRYDTRRFGQYDQQRGNDRRDWDRPSYGGYYQEQGWARDPSSGNQYGYEYDARVAPRRFNAGDESSDRWRQNVSEQNRRFDIDRGWHTPGTSGYGNTTQGHYGKGPKGYTRSDERIREDVCDRLSDDDEVDARDITVTVKSAEVILEGTVNDRRSKHRAEDIAESVSGVKEVTNHLRARKGFFQELGDKISGDGDAEHQGHRGSGTRNSTVGPAPQKTSH